MSTGLIRNTAIVSAMTLLSRILGFVRDMVLARAFGAGLALDAFFVAFKIPNLLRRMFGEGAFSLAFVPVLSEYKTRRDHPEVQALVDRVAGTLAGILILVSLLGVLASPLLVMLFAPGFIGEAGKFEITAAMLRVTFPYILFISLVAFAGSVLNTYGRFAVPAFAPVLLNLVLIAAALWWTPYFEQPVMALAWAVFIGGALQLGFMLPGLLRLHLLPRPRWGWRHSGVRQILRLMGPAILGSSVAQINLLFDTLIASFLVTGSVSWLYFADRMVEFPLGVFGIALSTVILPSLAHSHAAREPQQFRMLLDRALRWVFLLGTPATLGLLLLAGPIIVSLFQYEQFTPQQAEMTTLALMAYVLGLPAFILVKVLAPGFYSRQDTRTPVRIGIIAMVSNMGLNLLFVLPMVLLAIPGPHTGLAFATACSAWLNAGLLYRRLRREAVYAPQPGWWPVWGRILAAGGGMTVLLLLGPAPLEVWFARSGPERLFWLGLWIGAAGLLYLLLLQLFGQRLQTLWRRPDVALEEE
ncbi:murein biosynthesis integral membrane protein MurJ [Thiohalobacter sp. IOR34]|uniref:murein biosynthesis integral membrane protein MurJ n=1 Tax=Thiohalobacter sp. IOR34 TaxID=3057176 RepID=UPI0025B118BD|nr:murein biosynthesis integral membrane protein MurJ [Thiohalobacter sp. IOR34]WJW75101.1 murein biosynthesis integral membrane protein MurJ [Thiohalobacter sp. IOR34]